MTTLVEGKEDAAGGDELTEKEKEIIENLKIQIQKE